MAKKEVSTQSSLTSKTSNSASKRTIAFEVPMTDFNFKLFAVRVVKAAFVFLVLTVLSLGSLILLNEYISREKSSQQNLYNQSEYQIVYLNNNLFYFCKLEDLNPEYVACNDSYYLVKKTETDAAGKKEDKVYVKKPSEEELSKPEGSIYLLKENIVYIAKIGAESSVLDLINTAESK